MKRIYKYLLIILMMGLIIVLGTYAWLTYRSNNTAMVLTIGNINNVKVTLSPYQIKKTILPALTYEDEPYTSIEAINNNSFASKIKLYWKVNLIDSELAND